MMEVTGRSSREDGTSFDPNRTNVAIYCDPCENEGDEQPAEGFCVDCQEYLCSSCFKIHRRPTVLRHHVLKDKESMPKSKTLIEQVSYECSEPCSEHSSKLLEYFCQTHAKLGCPVCITENHRTCNDVDYIPNIADRFKESTEAKEVFRTHQSLKEQIEIFSAKIGNDKIRVKTYENDAKAQILQLRDEFNSICDRLVELVEDVSHYDESEIEGSLSTCEEILKKIKISESVLQKKLAEMKLSQFFTVAKLSKQSAEGYASELEVVKEHTKIRQYELKFNVEALREKFKLTFLDPPVEENNPDGQVIKVESTDNAEVQHGYFDNADCEEDDVQINIDCRSKETVYTDEEDERKTNTFSSLSQRKIRNLRKKKRSEKEKAKGSEANYYRRLTEKQADCEEDDVQINIDCRGKETVYTDEEDERKTNTFSSLSQRKIRNLRKKKRSEKEKTKGNEANYYRRLTEKQDF